MSELGLMESDLSHSLDPGLCSRPHSLGLTLHSGRRPFWAKVTR